MPESAGCTRSVSGGRFGGVFPGQHIVPLICEHSSSIVVVGFLLSQEEGGVGELAVRKEIDFIADSEEKVVPRILTYAWQIREDRDVEPLKCFLRTNPRDHEELRRTESI